MKTTFLPRRLAALAAALALTAALTGCGASGGGSADAVASTESMSAAAQEGASGGGVPHLDPGNATAENARKVIYNADVTLESTDFDAAQQAVLEAVETHGGYLSHSDLSGSAEDQDRFLHLTVRVPAAEYRSLLTALGNSANLLNASESADDITADYIDVQARLTALEAQRDRLNELADQAQTTADLLEIESQLSDVQYQIESYTQQQRWMDDQVDYSTVEVSLSEVKALTPETPAGFLEQAGRAFLDGWDAFSLFLKGLVLTVIYLWPVLVIAAVIVVVLWKTGPARRARRQARRMQAAPSPAPNAAVPNANTAPNADAAARNAPDPNGSAAPKPDAPKESKPGPKY